MRIRPSSWAWRQTAAGETAVAVMVATPAAVEASEPKGSDEQVQARVNGHEPLTLGPHDA